MQTLSALPVFSRLSALRFALTLTGVLLLAASVAQAAPTGLLNDTGQTLCANASNVMVACDSATTGDAGTRPRQDGRFGRDVASPTKVGGGAAGFDFSKVCMNGDIAGTASGAVGGNVTGTASTGNCAANPTANTTASPTATQWACTKDNVTNLIWSLESGQGDWNPYASITLPTATNSASRCGFSSGWRLPTLRELLGIVHNGLGLTPTIDANYFPATQRMYWTSDTWGPYPGYAWVVDFNNGAPEPENMTDTYYVRLVRSGQ
ncbi:MAG: DUF1566 domain-containing protein [Comamonadaceae bacterium]|nr:DUF1566 domain-containing protein [Comamonadaceae bacterium]